MVRVSHALPTGHQPNSARLRVHHHYVRVSTYNRVAMVDCARYVSRPLVSSQQSTLIHAVLPLQIS